MTQSKGDAISPKLSVTATIIKDAGDFGYPTTVQLDLTEWAKENKISSLWQLEAIHLDEDPLSAEARPISSKDIRFLISPEEYNVVEDEIYQIIDASIVNNNQAKAIKALISKAFNQKQKQLWDKLTQK